MMKRKIKAFLAGIGLLAALIVATPAQAAQTSSVVLDVPTYVQKNLSTQFQIHICSGASCASATRSIALYVDGKKIKTWKTSQKDILYSWKSSKVGSHTVQVKVASTGTYKAVNSSTKKLTVKTGMLNSAAQNWYSFTHCPTDWCTQFPVFITPTDNDASIVSVWMGTDYRQNGRKVLLQWKKANGSWSTDDTGIVEWDEDSSEYYANVQFQFDRDEWCEDSDGSEWSYRIFMPATSRATETNGYNRDLHLRCNVTYPGAGNAVADFDYQDQRTESASAFWFYTDGDSGVGMSLYVETCDLDEGLTCTDAADWTRDDTEILEIDSSDVGQWESRRVDDISGNFMVRGVVVPDDGSTVLYSDSYEIYNPYY